MLREPTRWRWITRPAYLTIARTHPPIQAWLHVLVVTTRKWGWCLSETRNYTETQTNEPFLPFLPDTHSKRVRGPGPWCEVYLWSLCPEFSQLTSWTHSIYGAVVPKGDRGERPVLTWTICKSDKEVVHMTGLRGGKTLTSHLIVFFPLCGNAQLRPSRLGAVLWCVSIGSKGASVRSDGMLSCVLAFCVPQSLQDVFAYDFPVPAMTHATSCSITPRFLPCSALFDFRNRTGTLLCLEICIGRSFSFFCTSDCHIFFWWHSPISRFIIASYTPLMSSRVVTVAL